MCLLAVCAGVLFFIQLLPVTICCFEYHKWQQSVGVSQLVWQWRWAGSCAAGGWWRQRPQHCRQHSFCVSSCRCMLCHAVLSCSVSAPMLCLPGVCLLSCACLLLQEGHPSTAATGSSRELDDLHAGDQLPVAQSCKDNQLVLPATATGFPHEFRYCYWSNEVYRPNKAHQQQQQYEPLPAGARQPAALAQVSFTCCFFSGTLAPSKCTLSV